MTNTNTEMRIMKHPAEVMMEAERAKQRDRQRKRRSDPVKRAADNARRRQRYHNDPKYREHTKQQTRNNMRRRYQEDTDYRESVKETTRERYRNDSEYREAQLEKKRDRYQEDTDYRESVKERTREHYRNDSEYREKKRERMRNDPEYRDKVNREATKRHMERYHTDPEFKAKCNKIRVEHRAKSRAATIGEHLERQNYICAGAEIYDGCEQQLDADSGVHIDHILPRSRGGSNDLSNLQAMCPPCNFSKGAQTMGRMGTQM